MPRHLLLNYLDEVRKQHECLLNEWQLTSPSHLDSVDSYPHNGALEDYVYRLPWLRVPDKGSVQHLANIENLKADIHALADGLKDLETYVDLSNSVVHIIQDDGEVIEVVPSSNPDSPPIDKHNVVEINRQLSTKKMAATETFYCNMSKSPAQNDKDKDKYLPELIEANIFQESLSKLPSLEALCERLKTKPVQDPMAKNELDVIRSELRFAGSNVEDKKPEKDCTGAELAKKMVAIQDLPLSDDHRLLEKPEILHTIQIVESQPLNLHQMISQETKVDLVADDIYDQHKKAAEPFLDSTVKEDYQEVFDAPIAPRKELHALNSERISERQTATDTLLFETVMEEIDALSVKKQDSQLQLLELDKEHLTHCNHKEILSSLDENQINTIMWNSEKHFIDYPSLRMQEPVLASKLRGKQKLHAPHQVAAIEHLKLGDKLYEISLASLLPWNPVEAIVPSMNKMSTKLEVYSTEMDRDDEDGGMVASKTRQSACMRDSEKVDLLQFDTWDNKDKCISNHTQDVYKKSPQPEAQTIKGPNQDEYRETQNTSTGPLDNTTVKKQTLSNPKEIESPLPAQTSANIPSHLSKSIEQSSSHLSPSSHQFIIRSTTIPTSRYTKENTSSGAIGSASKKELIKGQMFNPLDDFLMLRTVPQKREAVKTSPKKPSKITKKAIKGQSAATEVNQSSSKEQDTKLKLELHEVAPSKMSVAKKSKNNRVEVRLTDPFVDILGAIEMSTQPVLIQLRKMGIISSSYSFSSLTPDISRFLLKQQEKTQNNETDPNEVMRLRCLLQLHALITTADLITHCELTTAILHLSAVQEKYRSTLEDSMDNVRQTLYQKQCTLHKQQVTHPKLVSVIGLVDDWYKRKLNKKGGDQDPKILVIIRREARKLVEVVTEILAKVQGITTATIQSTPVMYDTVSKQLDACNCLVLVAMQIEQAFPWALFSLVVEYEYVEASPWLELCQRQNIRHMALETVVTSVVKDGKDRLKEVMDKECLEDVNSQSQGVQTLKVIASEDVIHCSQLLQLLESKYDIMLIERNYSKMKGDPTSSKLYFADLIIDERTGVILQDLHQLSETGAVESIVNRVTKLSLQYTTCWLICYRQKGKNSGYPLGGQAINSLARLQVTLGQFSIKMDGYEAKVLFADDLTEVSQLIRQIADNAAKSSVHWHQTDWLQRPWIANTVSKHEKLLLQFPFLNSFSAQVMLTAAPIRQLLTMPQAELVATCPWIQHRHLKMFHSFAHGLQENLPQPAAQQSTKTKLDVGTSSSEITHTPPKLSQMTSCTTNSKPSGQRSVVVGSTNQQQGQRHLQQQHLQRNTSGQTLQATQSRYSGDTSGCNFFNREDLAPTHHRGCTGCQFPVAVKQEFYEDRQTQMTLGSTDFNHKSSSNDVNDDIQIQQKSSEDMTPLEFIAKNIKQELGAVPQSYIPCNVSRQIHQRLVNHDVPSTSHLSHLDPNINYRHGTSDQQQPDSYDARHPMRSATSFQNHTKSAFYYPEEFSSSRYCYAKHPDYFVSDNRPATRQIIEHDSVSMSALLQGSLSKNTAPVAMCHHTQSQRSIDDSMHSVPQMRDKHPGYESGGYQRQVPVIQCYDGNSKNETVSSSRHYNKWTPPRDPAVEPHQAQGTYSTCHAGFTPWHSERVQYQSDQSVPTSAEMEIREDTYLADSYDEGDVEFDVESETANQQVPLTPSKKRRLTYERVPGSKGGQTRLAFF